MVFSNKETMRINSFVDTRISSPRDLFIRYGERIGSSGSFACNRTGDIGDPVIVSSGSVIDQMVTAQNFCTNINP